MYKEKIPHQKSVWKLEWREEYLYTKLVRISLCLGFFSFSFPITSLLILRGSWRLILAKETGHVAKDSSEGTYSAKLDHVVYLKQGGGPLGIFQDAAILFNAKRSAEVLQFKGGLFSRERGRIWYPGMNLLVGCDRQGLGSYLFRGGRKPL